MDLDLKNLYDQNIPDYNDVLNNIIQNSEDSDKMSIQDVRSVRGRQINQKPTPKETAIPPSIELAQQYGVTQFLKI